MSSRTSNLTLLHSDGKNITSTDPRSSSVESVTLYYIAFILGVAVLLVVIVITVVFLYKRSVIQRSSSATRRLFVRGFSTISQRGVLDSTAEFEIVTMMGDDSQSNSRGGSTSSSRVTTPAKPQRKKSRTTSSNNPKYENVTISPNADLVLMQRSVSMSSDIPYMDTTLESRLSRDDDLDDVFD